MSLDAATPDSPAASPVKDAADEAEAEAATAKEAQAAKEQQAELGAGGIAGFVHFRYEIEDGALVLQLHELHITPQARRRGLGKFTTMLSEMVARKAGMGGALLTGLRKEDNADALSFFTACKYGIDPMSPSKIDPTAEEEKPEILSKLWDQGVQQARAGKGAEMASRIAREAANGGRTKQVIGGRSIDECGAN